LPKIAVVDNLSFDGLVERNPTNIRIRLIFSQTRVIRLHYCRW